MRPSCGPNRPLLPSLLAAHASAHARQAASAGLGATMLRHGTAPRSDGAYCARRFVRPAPARPAAIHRGRGLGCADRTLRTLTGGTPAAHMRTSAYADEPWIMDHVHQIPQIACESLWARCAVAGARASAPWNQRSSAHAGTEVAHTPAHAAGVYKTKMCRAFEVTTPCGPDGFGSFAVMSWPIYLWAVSRRLHC